MRASLDATVRLFHCDLEVTGSSRGNSLSACGGKAAYIRPSSDPTIGVRATDPINVSSSNRANKRQRIPPNRTVITCEIYSILEDDPVGNGKRKKVSKSVPKKVVPKETTFICPICMGTLISPCSTVCGHIFCEGCIKAATQVKKICPTCRTKLTMKNNFHKVFLPTVADD